MNAFRSATPFVPSHSSRILPRLRPVSRVAPFLRRLVFTSLLTTVGLVSHSRAQIIKWDNGGGDALWGTAVNWSNNTLPGTTTTLTFDNTFVSTAQTIGLGSTTRSIGTLTFSSALNYTFNNGTNLLQINTAGTNFTQSGSGNVVFNSAIYMINGLTLAGSGAGTVTFNGNVSDNGGTDLLTMNGSFTLVLNGTNNSQDGTVINSGTVEFGSNSAGSNGLAFNGGTIRAGGGARTITNAVTVGGNFIVGGANDLTLSGKMDLGAATRTVTVDNTGTTTFSNAISNGGITKAGAGTLVLAGTNVYTNATSVNAGILKISADTNLGAVPGAVTADQLVLNGGTLNTSATFTLNANRGTTVGAGGGTFDINSGTTLTYNGILAGTGTLNKIDTGTLVLGGATTNTQTGDVNVTGGTLQIAKTVPNAALGDTAAVTVASGATLVFSGGVGETIGSLAGAGTVNNSNAAAITLITGGNNLDSTFSGVLGNTGGALALTKNGTGTLTLSGTSANTFTGALTINDGTVQLAKTGGINALGGNTVTIGDGIGAASSANLSLGAYQQIPDTAAVTIKSDGRLALNNFSEKIDTIAGTGLIDLSTSGFLTVGSSNGSSTFGGSVSGTGTLTKEGTGTLTFASSINFAGSLALAGGTLALNGYNLTVGILHITGNTILDFGLSTASLLNATTFIIDAGVTLTIKNWVDTVDFFYAQNWTGATLNTSGTAPMNQLTFTGFSSGLTHWQSYDKQISPVPEPATYGAMLVAFAAALACWRRRAHA